MKKYSYTIILSEEEFNHLMALCFTNSKECGKQGRLSKKLYKKLGDYAQDKYEQTR